MKKIILGFAICFAATCSAAQAELILTGVIDGDLSGGNPKAIVVTATEDIADLSVFGLGSANNGGGTDGQEFTLSGSATAGDVIVLAGNSDSTDFFTNNFTGLTLFQDGAANINGDDAVELFQDGVVIDTYGDIAVDGTDQAFEYSDGYAVRTGGSAGAFDITNYDVQDDALVGLEEAGHAGVIGEAFGFTANAVPEPTTAALFGFISLALCGMRRRSA